jgi:hypothetical protein
MGTVSVEVGEGQLGGVKTLAKFEGIMSVIREGRRRAGPDIGESSCSWSGNIEEEIFRGSGHL